jgi:hypothetical protein
LDDYNDDFLVVGSPTSTVVIKTDTARFGNVATAQYQLFDRLRYPGGGEPPLYITLPAFNGVAGPLPVPEPSTAFACGAALAPLLLRRRQACGRATR